ncbi:MAG: HTTM domain-containing protein [Myxococcota bacterium]
MEPNQPFAQRGRALLAALCAPRDLSALVAFRIAFGAMMAFGLTRFVAKGWIEKVLVEPTFFFKYPGLEWVAVIGPSGLYAVYAVATLAAVAIAIGLYYRWATIVFFFCFLYLQLLDVSLYLNHYYLVLILAGILTFLPLEGMLSMDAWRRPELRRESFPAWATYLLRFQVAIVYIFAALAKAHPDWLLHGQPLTLWMRARTDLPVLGPMLDAPGFGLLLSWLGFLYDATIWAFLLISRTRVWAYAVVLVFHGMTAAFFEIGMFPVIMAVATTVFFEPSWPRSLLGRLWPSPRVPDRSGGSRRLPAWLAAVLAVYVIVQVALPLRHYVLPGDVLWNERGMRFAWKVMVREKNGSVTYRVRVAGRTRPIEVSALDYLTWRQFSDISGQPDLILQLGQHVAWDLERRGYGKVEHVGADVWVSLNGRPPIPLVDPEVDLRTVGGGTSLNRWLLPGPQNPPPASFGWLR